MKTTTLYFGILLLLLSLSFGIKAQDVPQIINYQGNLALSDGNPVNNNLVMVFKIFAEGSGGTALWQEIHSSVQITDGLFHVPLGSVTAFPSNLFTGDRYLEIQIGNEVLSPRQKIGSVAYAMKAKTVPAAAIQAAETDPEVGTISTNRVPKWDGSKLLSSTIRDVNGNVGIGISSPQAKLDVNGDVDIRGRLLPDYDSDWVSDNDNSGHRKEFNHNFGDFPTNVTIWFTPSIPATVVYPLNWSWSAEQAGNPATIELTKNTVFLNIASGSTPLHGVWRPDSGWTKYATGFWRVLAWK